MQDCLFCKIAKKEIPVKIEYEDDDFLAFPDIEPRAKVHIILIPKKHFDSVAELSIQDTTIAGKIFLAANKVAATMNIDKTGYRLVTNIGKNAGQSVNHLHLHILGGEMLGQIC